METIDSCEDRSVAARFAAAVALYNEAAGPARSSTYTTYENPGDAVPPIDSRYLAEANEVYTRLVYPDSAALYGITGIELRLSKIDSPPQI